MKNDSSKNSRMNGQDGPISPGESQSTFPGEIVA